MGGHNAWITHEQTSIDAMAMAEMRERSPRQQPRSGLNTAHLESLLGQEVVITLGDASTRQGTVSDVDREGTVALRKTRPPLIRGCESTGSPSSSLGCDRVCVIPRDAVKGVEVVGGGAMAQAALRRVGGVDRPGSAARLRRYTQAAVQSSGAFLKTSSSPGPSVSTATPATPRSPLTMDGMRGRDASLSAARRGVAARS